MNNQNQKQVRVETLHSVLIMPVVDGVVNVRVHVYQTYATSMVDVNVDGVWRLGKERVATEIKDPVLKHTELIARGFAIAPARYGFHILDQN